MSAPKWKHRPCPCGCGELADECGSGGGLNAFRLAPPLGSVKGPMCECYPGGFTPDSYEGFQEGCPLHGMSGGAR